MSVSADYIWTPSDVFGGLQLVVAILGFALAIWQLVRTANATTRSADALGQRLISNDLLVLLPDLEQLEDSLDSAIKTTKPDKVGVALAEYARKAQRIHGHLRASPTYGGVALVGLIENSVEEARAAKEQLYGAATVDVVAVARSARQSIGKVILEAASFSATVQKGSNDGDQGRKHRRRARQTAGQDA